MSDPGARLARSWDANAAAWAGAVRDGAIESRRLATDAAILAAVAALGARTVFDVGCGEGWLCRALAAEGIDAVGVDGSAALVEAARRAGSGRFLHLPYAALEASPEQVGHRFDAAVCNFSLLHERVAPLLAALRSLLAPGGALVIQTVHPWSARGDAPYAPGWRTERFAGFAADFPEPMPWFYRTLGGWSDALHASGFHIERIAEPAHPETGEPLSLLLTAGAERTPSVPR